jgi:hypothetical protein
MKKFAILFYNMLAVIIGILCFCSFFFVTLNFSNGFISLDNELLAVIVGVFTIIGVVLFLVIGKRVFKSNNIVILASVLIIVAALLTVPAINTFQQIREVTKESYASTHQSEMVIHVNQILTESNLPFSLDTKKSNYYTLYHNDSLRLFIEKTNEDNLTIEEFDQLLNLLPTSLSGYSISVFYGKEKTIAVFLDKDKGNATCYADDYHLKFEIEKRYKINK